MTPHISQIPSTAESAKPTIERTFTPSSCGPVVAKIPIMLEPISPPTTMSATTSRLKASSELPHELVEPLVDEADLDLAVPDLLHEVVELVRRLGEHLRVADASRRARRATRCGANRSSMRSRAYGRATSKTLKSG